MGNTLLAASFFLLNIIVDGVQVFHYTFLNKIFNPFLSNIDEYIFSNDKIIRINSNNI